VFLGYFNKPPVERVRERERGQLNAQGNTRDKQTIANVTGAVA
jgi:hypothetical protein